MPYIPVLAARVFPALSAVTASFFPGYSSEPAAVVLQLATLRMAPRLWVHRCKNAVCSLDGARTFHLRRNEDDVLPRHRPFYTTDKGITGRRAHNPIHPGAEMAVADVSSSQVPFSVVCEEINGGGSRHNEG